ncbi:MAG: VOC family protein [Hyphomicrobiaceae bacterium]
MSKPGHGLFHWNELLTSDPEAAVKFFEDVVGWSFDAVEMGQPGAGQTYWVGKIDDQPAGGIMQIKGNAPDDMQPHWVCYLEVDNIDKRIFAARKAGAVVLTEPFDVPGVGRIAMVQDPTGGIMGWIMPET